MTEIYLKHSPKAKCKDCVYLTRIINSRTGERYCKELDCYVSEDSLCPDFKCGGLE